MCNRGVTSVFACALLLILGTSSQPVERNQFIRTSRGSSESAQSLLDAKTKEATSHGKKAIVVDGQGDIADVGMLKSKVRRHSLLVRAQRLRDKALSRDQRSRMRSQLRSDRAQLQAVVDLDGVVVVTPAPILPTLAPVAPASATSIISPDPPQPVAPTLATTAQPSAPAQQPATDASNQGNQQADKNGGGMFILVSVFLACGIAMAAAMIFFKHGTTLNTSRLAGLAVNEEAGEAAKSSKSRRSYRQAVLEGQHSAGEESDSYEDAAAKASAKAGEQRPYRERRQQQ
jgi:hypothetical protein|mmetsp:Transcript_103067/g.162900  ORF Transcript_103067/g.162900 Transcript_103067/m.162900 type:complete len:288 (-) Transcript_103067:45-908(-)